jgi:hypothetical protein
MIQKPPPLDYRRDDRRHQKLYELPPSALPLILCLPGAVCWLLLICGNFLASLVPELYDFMRTLFWVSFPVAVITAVISVSLYVRRPTRPLPWYVLINLGINIPGLLIGVPVFLSAL